MACKKRQIESNLFVIVAACRAERGEESGGAAVGVGGGLMRELDTLQMDDFNDLCTGFQK
jgi:hypothetical protein